MGWATSYINDLKNGKTVKCRPKGNSMAGKIESGQLCTIIPIAEDVILEKGMIVLCKVNGNQYLHLISAIGPDGRIQISNNKGYVNGWTSRKNIFGILERVDA